MKVAIETGLREEFIVYMDDETYFAEPRHVGEEVHAAWESSVNHRLKGTNNSAGMPSDD